MGKKNVIVYGLGVSLEKYRQYICNVFNVIGYSDQNIHLSREKEYNPFIWPEDLCQNDKDTYILVCSTGLYREIVFDLVFKYNVKTDRILLLQDEINKMKWQRKEKDMFISFSQFGEDYVIFQLLKKYGIFEKGCSYIELGVDDPIHWNNTYFLELIGCGGVLVEANPETIPLIEISRKNRTKLLNNVVVQDNMKEKELFHIANAPGLSSVLEKNIALNNGAIKRSVLVNTIQVNDIFELNTNPSVLSIDLEGLDVVILRSIDFDKYRPYVICAETGWADNEIIEYMRGNGYCLYFENGINTIWCI